MGGGPGSLVCAGVQLTQSSALGEENIAGVVWQSAHSHLAHWLQPLLLVPPPGARYPPLLGGRALPRLLCPEPLCGWGSSQEGLGRGHNGLVVPASPGHSACLSPTHLPTSCHHRQAPTSHGECEGPRPHGLCGALCSPPLLLVLAWVLLWVGSWLWPPTAWCHPWAQLRDLGVPLSGVLVPRPPP